LFLTELDYHTEDTVAVFARPQHDGFLLKCLPSAQEIPIGGPVSV